ncbi:hypothetical protein MRP04_05235 [Dickeya dianthicola]|nr:hypothetical protein [Dickeya dianthicola]MCI4029904.1 hypothetical protein [Dickeya dianthicola]MCI4174091.1 hypothetical protein [Dickeya dianthicola]MCI4176108.1 hypothetical protein [Dickeya dianthicola]MCI4183413.1 hypothetical protein [Dickeya dianthicola]MCI4193386.1 hypothetical protein [Dickeya dianthicola]
MNIRFVLDGGVAIRLRELDLVDKFVPNQLQLLAGGNNVGLFNLITRPAKRKMFGLILCGRHITDVTDLPVPRYTGFIRISGVRRQ